MKTKYNRLSRLSQIVLAVATTGALMSSAHATTYTWISVDGNGGNWSDSTKWDANGVPSNDGTADVVIPVNISGWPWYNINPAGSSWSIHGITFSTAPSGYWGQPYMGGNLTIGAGGITENSGYVEFNVNTEVTSSQAWNLNNGSFSVRGNLTLDNGVTITKSGYDLNFTRGTTTTVGTGAIAMTSGTLSLQDATQFGRLGTNTFTIDSTSNTRMGLTLGGNVSGTFPTNINLVGGFTGNNTNLNLVWGNYSTDTGTSVTLTGTLSGSLQGGWVNGTGFIAPQMYTCPTYDDRYNIVFQGDGSGLYSLNPTSWWDGILHITNGVIILNNPNAMGIGNKLSFFAGKNDNWTTNHMCGLLATNGNNVSGPIFVNAVENGNGGQNHTPLVELGLKGTGSVTFSGAIGLEEYTGSPNQNQRLKLVAPTGGSATFSGVISGAGTGSPITSYVPITILGGGTVTLSGNNSYHGQTNIREGTLLLSGSSNAMGQSTSNVSLGDTVSVPAGGDVTCATTAEVGPVGNNYPWNNSYSAGVMTFGTPVVSIDGVLLSAGTRILYKDAGNAERTGVYTYTDSTHWTRATDLNTAAAFVKGLRVHVRYGNINAGKNFYLTEGLVTPVFTNPVLGSTAGDGTNAIFVFNPDAQTNANVALLTNDALTINRNIDVTNNLSTGQSILGGNSAVTSTFSGTVTLYKDLAVQAASSGTVIFSGDITGGNNVVAQGSGLVKFSTAKSYTGTTTVNSGTLEVGNTLASSGVSVSGAGTLQGTGTVTNTLSVTDSGIVSPGVNGTGTLTTGAATISGHLSVQVNDPTVNKLVSTGAINLSGGTVDVSVGGAGFTGPYVIAQGTSITGTPSVTTGYQVAVVTAGSVKQLVLSQAPTNSFTAWVAGYPTLTDTTPGGNPSHDGISNLMKYALGLDPTKSAQPAGSVSSGTLTFEKGTMAQGDGNLAYSIEESPDLVTWTTQSGPSVSNGPTAITYTFPTGQTKVFARLKVIQTP